MNKDNIARFRRFNRSVTSEVGALDDSFLDRGRSLGSARVLNAIGIGYENVSDLRGFLKLDTGLLSRLLRGLEAEGLVVTTQNPTDKRGRIARHTPKGQQEFEIYEQLSNARAAEMLSRHKHAERILEAMDVVTVAMSHDQIVIEETDYASDIADVCLKAFASELGARLGITFDLKKAGDPDLSQMKHPHGTFVVARLGDMPIGCVGVKGNGTDTAEIKRLWIAPAARGFGLARRLMSTAEDAARNLGIDVLRLDTNSALSEAVALYHATGWIEIDRFNDDPYPDVFFEKNVN